MARGMGISRSRKDSCVYIQYVGFDTAAGSRSYSFHVIDTPHETRDFTVEVQSEAFRAARLQLQDGPAICLARLKEELQGETQESPALAHLSVEERDVQQYLDLRHTRAPSKYKGASRRELNERYEQDPSSTQSNAMTTAKLQGS
jgi:hypothetical protein